LKSGERGENIQNDYLTEEKIGARWKKTSRGTKVQKKITDPDGGDPERTFLEGLATRKKEWESGRVQVQSHQREKGKNTWQPSLNKGIKVKDID